MGLRWGILAIGLLGVANMGRAEVETKVVTYQHGGVEYRGFLAWDSANSERRPGVLVVHEWWGLNDYARGRAKQLAELGYVAFAADMYGGGKVTEHPAEAGEMATRVRANVQEWRGRAEAALQVLRQDSHCDAQRVAVMGYCFGGSTALQLAYTGADLRAVATFHAMLPVPTPEEAARVKAQVLVNHGAADSFIPAEAIQKFRSALDTAKVSYEFAEYAGAEHSFTVRDAAKHGVKGLKYDAAADQASWDKLVKLLEHRFGQ